jgi:hypothetical protein
VRNVGIQEGTKTHYYVKIAKFGLNFYDIRANIVIEPSIETTAKMEAEEKYMRLWAAPAIRSSLRGPDERA